MTFFSSIIFFANQILTFYLPIFYAFKYLSGGNPANVAKILKFWCVLAFSYILQYIYSRILAENIDIIIDLTLHLLLVFQEFAYSEKIYDNLIRPCYKNNEQAINNFSKTLESYFEKKTQQVQSKVSESATDKIRGFVGDILVGTLNPANKKKESKMEQRDQNKEEDEDQKQD